MENRRFLPFLKARLAALLATFLAAEVAMLLFVLAENAWPRAVPEALGWALYFGSWPWWLPWRGAADDQPALAMIAISASFGLNVVIVATAGWYVAWRRMKR